MDAGRAARASALSRAYSAMIGAMSGTVSRALYPRFSAAWSNVP